MRYTVEWIKNKQTKTGKPFKIVSLKDESGKVTEDVSAFDFKFPALDTLTPGATIEGEIQIDGTYKNLMSELKPPAFAQKGSAFKEKVIAEAQQRKSESIAQAQDRSAWMWAKNNASMLIANHPALKETSIGELPEMVNELATRIYNGEPTEPFTEPKEDKF